MSDRTKKSGRRRPAVSSEEELNGAEVDVDIEEPNGTGEKIRIEFNEKEWYNKFWNIAGIFFVFGQSVTYEEVLALNSPTGDTTGRSWWNVLYDFLIPTVIVIAMYIGFRIYLAFKKRKHQNLQDEEEEEEREIILRKKKPKGKRKTRRSLERKIKIKENNQESIPLRNFSMPPSATVSPLGIPWNINKNQPRTDVN